MMPTADTKNIVQQQLMMQDVINDENYRILFLKNIKKEITED
jgi:hypothetical protein